MKNLLEHRRITNDLLLKVEEVIRIYDSAPEELEFASGSSMRLQMAQIKDDLRKSLDSDNIELQNILNDKRSNCKHKQIDKLVIDDGIVYECRNCHMLFSEIPDGSKVIGVKTYD